MDTNNQAPIPDEEDLHDTNEQSLALDAHNGEVNLVEGPVLAEMMIKEHYSIRCSSTTSIKDFIWYKVKGYLCITLYSACCIFGTAPELLYF